MLVKAQLVTEPQLEEALTLQRREGGKLGSIVVRLGFCADQDIVSFLGMQYGVPAADLDQWPTIETAVIALVPAELANKHKVLPLQRSGNVLTMAMSDPTDIFAMDDVRFHTGYNIDPVVSSEMGLIRAIERYYGGSSSLRLREKDSRTNERDRDRDKSPFAEPEETSALGGALQPFEDGPEEALDLKELEEELSGAETEYETAADDEEDISAFAMKKGSEEAPVVRLVNMVLIDAIRKGASDIHIEPYEKSYRIRFRIDGLLQEVMRPSIKLKDPVTSRVKILAKLNIAEKRLPQDGRIKLRVALGGRQKVIDYRVSILPTLFGEKIVLRLLDSDKLMLDLTKLGFEPESLVQWDRQISKPYGMVLVTGPTGSGKTNTLYSSIAKLNQVDVNIMTAEDPVEFNFAGINQVQMKEQIGLNFAVALRSFLRQDPNIILVGEIRDFETAEIAIKASLTGHLVLSTLHTNDAPLHHQPAHEHGRGAVPGGHQRQHHLRPAPGPPHLRQVQAGGGPPAAVRGAAEDRLHRGGGEEGHHGPEGCRLRGVRRPRLQGAGRPVRGPGDVRDPQGHDPDRGQRHRAAGAGPEGRHDHPPAFRVPEGDGRRHHHRGDRPRNGPLTTRRTGWLRTQLNM